MIFDDMMMISDDIWWHGDDIWWYLMTWLWSKPRWYQARSLLVVYGPAVRRLWQGVWGAVPKPRRENQLAKSVGAQSCTLKNWTGISQIYHTLLNLMTSLFDILQPFFQISGINLQFIPLKLIQILRSEKMKMVKNFTADYFWWNQSSSLCKTYVEMKILKYFCWEFSEKMRKKRKCWEKSKYADRIP